MTCRKSKRKEGVAGDCPAALPSPRKSKQKHLFPQRACQWVTHGTRTRAQVPGWSELKKTGKDSISWRSMVSVKAGGPGLGSFLDLSREASW